MADQYVPYPLPPCPDPPVEPAPQPCADWSICLPFGGRLASRNGCVYAEQGNPPADGVYGKIVIANGCIAGVGPVEACVDNIGVCASTPAACSGASAASVEPVAYAAAPVNVQCIIHGGDGIQITGSGTDDDPFIISALAIEVKTYAISETDAIAVRGSGTYANPLAFAHKLGQQANVNGMVFDRYGHLVDVSEVVNRTGIEGVIGGVGIDVQRDYDNRVVTVSTSKPVRPRGGVYDIGGWKVTLDEYNRVFEIERQIELPGATYPLGVFDVGISSTGSIASIAQNGNGFGINYIFHWPSGKTPTLREALFTLRSPTALGGVLYTKGESSFWQVVDITINDVVADIARPVAGAISESVMFWSFGIFAPGQHRIAITSSIPWDAASGATVHLFALSKPDAIAES